MGMRWLSAVGIVCTLAACSGSPTSPSAAGSGGSGGGSGGSGGGSGGSGGGLTATCPQTLGGAIRAQGTLVASINGAAWTADCIGVILSVPNVLSLAGSDLATGAAYQTFGFAGTRAVGTQAITPTSPLNANLQQGSNVWHASLIQGSGSVVITNSTSNGAAGTFTFVLPPAPGSPATGTKTVTGSFNLTF
jgi:hypothetical protein